MLALLGTYVFGTLGVNLCYHRLLTHRGLVCPKWLEHTLAILGVCCFQDTPARWVAVHRRHHECSGRTAGSAQPAGELSVGVHLQWIYVENRELNRLRIYDRYAKGIFCATGFMLRSNAAMPGSSLARMSMVVSTLGGERDMSADAAVLKAMRGAADPAARLNETLMTELRPTFFLGQLPNLLAGNIAIVHGVTRIGRAFCSAKRKPASTLRIAAARCQRAKRLRARRCKLQRRPHGHPALPGVGGACTGRC